MHRFGAVLGERKSRGGEEGEERRARKGKDKLRMKIECIESVNLVVSSVGNG